MLSTTEQQDLDLQAGDTDSHGDAVARVYDKLSGKYIIYETKNGALKCGDAGVTLTQDPTILGLLTAVGDLLHASSPQLARRYNSHRALATTYWCKGEIAAAVRVLEDTHSSLLRVLGRRARLLYLSGSVAVVIVVSVAVLASTAFGTGTLTTWLLVSLFGALGAFVSVALRGQSPALDVLEDAKVTFVYGGVRAFVAIVFALVMYLLVLGGVVLPAIATEGAFRMLVLAFVAGFSEKLVPEAVIHQAIGAGNHK